jgi:hypothetical protein
MRRSPERLAGEARTGLVPYRGMLVSWALEAVLLIAVIVLPSRLLSMRPYEPPPMPKYDIIYFSGDELPRTEDAGGAQSGRSGRSGGQEARHRTQTIRIARGGSLREKIVDAPKLNLPKSDAAVANLLAYKPIPGPAPAEGLRSSLRAPVLPQTAVPPAPLVERDKIQAPPTLNANVIAPAPAAPGREIATLRVPGSQAAEVIPPRISAPEQLANLNPKLTLPAPTVIAPPPTHITRDISSLGPGWGSGDLHKQVVPPPVQMGGVSDERKTSGGLDDPSVVPPPVQLGGGSLQHQPVSGLGGGPAVVPPPPTVSGGSSLTGQGRGNRGAGLGGPLDVGVATAPPTNGGGSGGGTGIVVSSQPGSKVGVPGNGGTGSLAMSPTGGDKPGLGGSGGGAGIGRGNGPGSGFSGEGPGAGKEGAGHGSDPSARGGISPYPGPGGAGSGTSGTPAMPGVSVRGGSNTITLPSFGSTGNQPDVPGRSSVGADRHRLGITVVATSRSGGAFNFYGLLKGDRVYTTYIPTALGTAVMQFADAASAAHPYAEDLTAPEPLRSDLPASLQRSRLVITCILDRSGVLQNLRVLEAGGAQMTAKVLAALPGWRFSPVLRRGQPVEVNVILGFGIDTNDRF